MQRIKFIGLALMAVFGLSAMLASSAMAAGPLWLVEHRECKEQATAVFATQLDCENNENAGSFKPGWEFTGTILDHLLQAGEMADAKVTNLGHFRLVTSRLTILCQHLSAPTLLLGGTPGKSDTKIEFSTCTVEGPKGEPFPECDANSKGLKGGNIEVKAKDELVYIGTEKQAKNEEGPLGDLFLGEEEGGKAFVTIEFEPLKTGACPAEAVTTKVTGSVVGEVAPVEEMVKTGTLTFPEKAIKEAYVWEAKGKVKEVKPALKAFVIVTATQVGKADVELLSGLLWGVHNK